MPDVHDTEARSRNMRAIKGKNTKPEIAVRKELHAAGFRFRLHPDALPGKPDLALPKYRAVIFVHGCFWHQHNCSMFKMPTQRREFWRDKLIKNVGRDERALDALRQAGWRVAVVWECSMRGPQKLPPGAVLRELSTWLKQGGETLEIRGL